MICRERLLQETAVAGATALMNDIGAVFMAHERQEAWTLCFEHIRVALEVYFIMDSREQVHLQPSNN